MNRKWITPVALLLSGTSALGAVTNETTVATGGGSCGEYYYSDAQCGGPVQQEEPETPSEEKPREKLKFKLEPIFYLGIDFGKKIINQTLNYVSNPASLGEIPGFNPAHDTLMKGDYSGGVKVVKYRVLEAGVGVRGRWYYDNAESWIKDNFGAYVGLLPIAGRQVMTVQSAPSREAARNLPPLTTPLHSEDLETWQVGDNATYGSSGGVAFLAGAGIGPVSAGAVVLARGTWKTRVEKTGPYSAYVKVSKAKLNSLTAFVSATLVSVGVTWFKESDRGFSFMFDLTNEIGRLAYEDLIQGNVAGVQELARNPYLNGVQAVDSTRTWSRGRSRHFSIGLPLFLNTSWSTGNIAILKQTENYLDNSSSDVRYGVYVRDHRTNFFFNHSGNVESFYGARYTETRPDGSVRNGHFGELFWKYENENASSSKLRGAIKSLIRKTGLKDYLQLNVPADGDIDYASVAFNLQFPDSATSRMMVLASTGNGHEFVKANLKRFDAYMKHTSDPNDFCAEYAWEMDRCRSEMRRDTSRALYSMWANLKVMSQVKDSRPDAFARAYAQFGRSLLRNGFTLQAGLFLAGQGATLSYLVEGAEISRYAVRFVLDAENKLVVDAAPRASRWSLGSEVPVITWPREIGVIGAPNWPVVPVPVPLPLPRL